MVDSHIYTSPWKTTPECFIKGNITYTAFQPWKKFTRNVSERACKKCSSSLTRCSLSLKRQWLKQEGFHASSFASFFCRLMHSLTRGRTAVPRDLCYWINLPWRHLGMCVIHVSWGCMKSAWSWALWAGSLQVFWQTGWTGSAPHPLVTPGTRYPCTPLAAETHLR